MIGKNRAAAVKVCNDVWGAYEGNVLNCDEFPFASTKEGSALGDNRFSARLLGAADNQAAGNLLNAVYTANRLLDGDPFYVRILP